MPYVCYNVLLSVSLQDCIQLNQYKLKCEIGKVSHLSGLVSLNQLCSAVLTYSYLLNKVTVSLLIHRNSIMNIQHSSLFITSLTSMRQLIKLGVFICYRAPMVWSNLPTMKTMTNIM